MTSELTQTLLLASRGLERLITLRSAGNPNHDAEGKFASGPGGHGKHWAKRQRRRKRRKKTLERMRREGHRDIADQKDTHREGHKDMIAEQKDNWKGLLKEHKSSRKEFIRDAKKEHKALRREQRKDRNDLIREKKQDHADEQREMKRDDVHEDDRKTAAELRQTDLKESLARQRAEHKEARADSLASHKEGFKSLKEDQATERGDRKASDQEDRQQYREGTQQERRELLGHLKDEIHEKFPNLKRKSAKGGDRAGRSSARDSDAGRDNLPGVLRDTNSDDAGRGDAVHEQFPRSERRGDQVDRGTQKPPVEPSHSIGGDRGTGHETSTDRMADRLELGITRAQTANARRTGSTRFAKSKTHKASSAEAILQHVLRQRGWSKAWTEGRLTGRQHLQLLEDVRQYGRAWLRHEAEAFFGRYGDVERGISDSSQVLGSPDVGKNIGRGSSDDRLGGCAAGASLGTGLSADDSRSMGGIQGGTRCPGKEGLDEQPAIEPLALPREWAIPQPAQAIREGGDRGIDHVSDEPGDRGVHSEGIDLSRSIDPSILPALQRWRDRNIGFIQELMVAAAMSQEGPKLSDETNRFVADLTRVQREYLDQFYRDIANRTPLEIKNILGPEVPGFHPYSKAQVVARAEQYGNAAWQGGQKVLRRRKKASGGARWERRILGHPKTEHCNDCPPLAKLGWQPIGTLPDIGDTECGGRCYCHFEYSDSVETPTVKAPEAGKPANPKKPKKVALKGTQEAIDQLLNNPQFNEAMKNLKITMKVQVGKGG